MKERFPGFYRPSEDEFATLWRECLFVLDANVLLNLYRYPQQARDELIKILTPVADRIWVPFQAALEYQRNRPSVIAEQKKRFREVRTVVGDIVGNLEGEFGRLQLRERHALIDPDGLVQNIQPIIKKFRDELDELEKTQGNVHDDDPLRDQIDELLNDRVGPAPEKKDIDSICTEGEERFASNIPPGFMDEKKESGANGVYSYGGITYQAKFGDLILWKQLLKHAKVSDTKSVIFLTDDEKQDWWWTIESQGKKKLGPRPELVDEMRRETNVNHFYIYNSVQFLNFARQYLAAEVSEESIEQVREITSRASRPTPKNISKQQHELAENAVAEWLITRYPTANLIRTERGWPDFILNMEGAGDVVGFEIMLFRNFMGMVMRTRDRMYRAYHDIHEQKFSRFEFVFVLADTEDEDRIIRYLEADRMKVPSGVSFTLGRLVPDRNTETGYLFVPIDNNLTKFVSD